MTKVEKFTGGTPTALKLFSALDRREIVVSPYTDSWLSKNANAIGINFEEYKSWKGGLENLADIVFIDLVSMDTEEINELLTLYPPLRETYSSDQQMIMVNPDFLIINLKSQQILLVGLGRHDGVHTKALVDGEWVWIEESQYANYINQSFEKDDDRGEAVDHPFIFLEKFCEGDDLELVDQFWEALRNFGEYSFRFQSLPGSIQEIEDARQDGMDAEGYYTVDGENLTQEELDEVSEEYSQCEKGMSDAATFIQLFFPQLDAYELITGAY